jgi:uncharacterized protein (DUF1778 family)
MHYRVKVVALPGSVRKKKVHPLSMRLLESDVAIIDRAARMRGRSRTDFVRDAAVRAAEEVVMENTMIRLSSEGFRAFMDIISAPPTPISEMVKVFSRKAPWEG